MTQPQTQEQTGLPTTILLAAKRNKPKNENQQAVDPDLYKQKSSKPYCQDLLNDISALLDGGNKQIKNGRFFLKDPEKYLSDITSVARSIQERITDLKEDKLGLHNNHQKLNQAHPKYGSYEGHRIFLERQQQQLQKAVADLKDNCKNFTAKEQELIDRAEDAIKQPIPQKPDESKQENSSSNSENKTLRRAIDSIPLIPQTQKDSLIKTLESTGIPKILKDSINGGKDYWDKHGKQQLTDALDGLVKAGTIAGGIAIAIVVGVGNALTGGWLQGESTTEPTNSTNVASTSTDTVASTNQNPSPTNQFATGEASPTGTNRQGKQDTAFIGSIDSNTDTAFIGTVNPSSDTALRGSVDTALRIGISQQQQQTQQPQLTPS